MLALCQCNSKGLIFGDIKLDDDGMFRMHYLLCVAIVQPFTIVFYL